MVIQMSSAGGGVPERTTASGGAGSSGAGAHPSAKKSAGAKADDSGDEMAESTLDLTGKGRRGRLSKIRDKDIRPRKVDR